jgi:hypothetical protein
MLSRVMNIATIVAWLFIPQVYAQHGFDPIDPTKMVLESITPINGALDFQLYNHPLGAPGSNKYNRPDAVLPFKTGLIVPHTPPGDHSVKLVEHFDGYSADVSAGPNNNFSAPGYVVIKTHPGHYPTTASYAVGGVEPLDWGGFAKGDSNRWRFGVGFQKVKELMGSSIDWKAGLRLEGNSYGGTTAILQSLLLKDPWAQARVTIVNAVVPNTLFVRQDTTPNDGINQSGMYYRNPAAVRLAWDDPSNPGTADIIAHSDKLKGKYYSVFGNSGDTIVKFDLEFFTLFCEAKKIACFGAWVNGDHGDYDRYPLTGGGTAGVEYNWDRTSAVGLPWHEDADAGPSGPFSGPDSDARLDKILPIFTKSTANHFSIIPGQPGFVRGHYNLGLEWNSKAQPAVTASSAVLPIRYRKHTGFGTGAVYAAGNASPDPNAANYIPDQPDSATFTLTLTRTGNFLLPIGKVVQYTLPAQGIRPAQTGTVTVTVANEVTIPELTLDNSTSYINLTLVPVTHASK